MEARTRVLIVDARAEALGSLVAAWGCDVDYARSGGEALLAFARPPHPDVAIIDVALPDLDGCDVIRTPRIGSAGMPEAAVAVPDSDPCSAHERDRVYGLVIRARLLRRRAAALTMRAEVLHRRAAELCEVLRWHTARAERLVRECLNPGAPSASASRGRGRKRLRRPRPASIRLVRR